MKSKYIETPEKMWELFEAYRDSRKPREIQKATPKGVVSEFHMPLAKSDPQATLATLTYARRGALMAILGIPAVDDDGETAVGRGTDTAASGPRQAPPATAKPAPQPTLTERANRLAATLEARQSKKPFSAQKPP